MALAFMALGLGLWSAERRRPARGRTTVQFDRPAIWAHMAAVVVVVVASLVADPLGLPAWYLVVTLLPAVPATAAAVANLRS